jgi:hypothetical protein
MGGQSSRLDDCRLVEGMEDQERGKRGMGTWAYSRAVESLGTTGTLVWPSVLVRSHMASEMVGSLVDSLAGKTDMTRRRRACCTVLVGQLNPLHVDILGCGFPVGGCAAGKYRGQQQVRAGSIAQDVNAILLRHLPQPELGILEVMMASTAERNPALGWRSGKVEAG